MKSLKKILTLVLVVAMVLSIGAIGASAAFTDTSSAKYTEAIEVLAGIGVINGTTSTTFEPTGSLTRESAAKIITYLLLGPTNAALISTATSQKFSDVAPTRWSAGYIEYCANAGIIGGTGDGTFNPAGTLTTPAFTKMLLCAVGYNASVEGFTGTSWVNNVASVALYAGIADAGIAITGSSICTRDQAAQLAFKALTANTVQYSGGNTITVGGTTITTGATRTNVLGSIAANANYDGAVGDGLAQFCETHFAALKLVTTSTDANGMTAHKWQLAGTSISGNYNTAILLKSSSNGTAWASLTDVNNTYFIGVKPNTTVTYFMNGAASNLAAITAASAVTGDVISFIDTDYDGLYNAVSAIHKSVLKLAAAPTTSTNSAGDATVTISSLGMYNVLAYTLSGYAGLAKDDYILYWKSASDSVTYIEKATAVTGIVTGFNGFFGVKVTGTYHADSGLTANSFPGWTTDDYLNSYTFYLDNSGAVIASVQGSTIAASNLAVLSSIVFVSGNGVSSFDSAQAKIIKADGTTAIVNVSSIDGDVVAGINLSAYDNTAGAGGALLSATATVGNSYTGYLAVNDSTTAVNLVVVSTSAAANTMFTGGFYFFSTTSTGAYVLTTTPPTGYTYTDLANHVITNSAPLFDGTAVANSSTVFIYETIVAGVPVYTVYTGIGNVPTTAAAPTNHAVSNTIIKDASGVAKYVFAQVGATTAAITDVIYFPFAGYSTTYENSTVYYEKYAVVNGVVNTSLRVASGDKAFVGVYTSSNKSSDGIYTVASASVTTGVTSNSGGVLVTDGDGYTYTSSTKAYYINTLGVVTEMTADGIALSAIDTIYVKPVAGTTTVASIIYVMQATAAPSSLVLAEVGATTISVTDGDLIAGGTGALTGFATTTADTVTITAGALTNCTLSSMTINGVAYTSGDNYVIAATGTYTVQMIYTDDISGAVYTTASYTFTVAA